jgi:phage-related protein
LKKWQVIFYEAANGSYPAYEFIESLPDKLGTKVYRDISILQEYGNAIREPYSKYLDDGIFELRTHKGTDTSRILYFFYIDNLIVLTNGFVKKTNKTPAKEIKLAKLYRNDFLTRKR